MGNSKIAPPKNRVGYPCADGWLLQCEAYFSELQNLGSRAEVQIRDALTDLDDTNEHTLNDFIRKWVRLLALLATRENPQQVKTRFCMIARPYYSSASNAAGKPAADVSYFHKTLEDSRSFKRLFIQVNAAVEQGQKEYLAYAIVGCNSSEKSVICCNTCDKKDCNEARVPVVSVFSTEIYGMLHADYIAIPSFDFRAVLKNKNNEKYIFENAVMDMAYLFCYLEAFLGASNGASHVVLTALRDAIKTSEVTTNASLLRSNSPDDKEKSMLLMSNKSYSVLPQALYPVIPNT